MPAACARICLILWRICQKPGQAGWLEVEKFMADLARASPLELQIEGARKIFVDPVLLNRLLLNLFRNAHQAGASRV